VWLHHVGKAASREGQHGLTTLETTLVKALATGSVDGAIHEDAINPTFHDRGHREPPKRKLQDQQIAGEQLVDLGLDVGRESVTLRGLLLFAVVLQCIGESTFKEIL